MLRNYALALLNWFYPRRCISCKKSISFDDRRHLCTVCWNAIKPVGDLICVKCGTHLPDSGMHCYHCKRERFHFSAVRCFGLFDGGLRDLVHHFKYSGKDYLCEDLAQFLLYAWKRYPELYDSEILIPIPLHARSLRERGYNQSHLLAKKFLSLLKNHSGGCHGQARTSSYNLFKEWCCTLIIFFKRRCRGVQSSTLPRAEWRPAGSSLDNLKMSENGTSSLELMDNVLVRVRKTPSQTQLPREERLMNMESAFQVKEGFAGQISGKIVLLVDDVCTTGATINECAKVLRKAGAKKVFGLTLARD